MASVSLGEDEVSSIGTTLPPRVRIAPPTEENRMANADVLRDLVQAFNEHDYDRIEGFLDVDCEFVDVATGEVSRGPDAIVDAFRRWEAAFPDLHVAEVNVVSTEVGAVGEFRARGTHDGPLGDIPPTGRKVEEQFSVIAEIEDGKLTGFREYYDALTLMTQLRVLPEPAQAG